jgi:hypothetical protein
MKSGLVLVFLLSVALVSVSGQLTLDALGGICRLNDFLKLKCPGKDNTGCIVCVFQANRNFILLLRESIFESLLDEKVKVSG